VDESPEHIPASDLPVEDLPRVESRFGRFKVEAPMRSGPVVVLGIRAEDAPQVTPPEDEDVIDALSTDGAHPTFRDGVRLRRANWRPHHAEPVRPENLIEGAGELRVSVPEQDVPFLEVSSDREVPSLLGNPG